MLADSPSLELLALALAFALGSLGGGLVTALRTRPRLAALQARLEQEQQAQARLGETFRALSQEALLQNNQMFLDLAETRLKQTQQGAVGDLEKRQAAIAHLVKPLKESVDKLEALTRADTAGLRQYLDTLLQSQQKLAEETSALKRALRSPLGRGQWGEMVLQRTVELAGMQQGVDFLLQVVSQASEGGRVRPDLVVQMPGGKQVIVDAKTPLEAYLNAIEAEDDAARGKEIARHAHQVREHIRQLGSKTYWDKFEATPEFVILFLPGESIFRAAVEHDPSLLDDAIAQRVLLASPLTLIALLKTVAYGWRQEALADNARKIAAQGRELYERLIKFTNDLSGVGDGLGKAMKKYNEAVASFESRVLPSVRRFEQLKAAPDDRKITDPAQIEVAPRQIQAAKADVSPSTTPLPDGFGGTDAEDAA